MGKDTLQYVGACYACSQRETNVFTETNGRYTVTPTLYDQWRGAPNSSIWHTYFVFRNPHYGESGFYKNRSETIISITSSSYQQYTNKGSWGSTEYDWRIISDDTGPKITIYGATSNPIGSITYGNENTKITRIGSEFGTSWNSSRKTVSETFKNGNTIDNYQYIVIVASTYADFAYAINGLSTSIEYSESISSIDFTDASGTQFRPDKSYTFSASSKWENASQRSISFSLKQGTKTVTPTPVISNGKYTATIAAGTFVADTSVRFTVTTTSSDGKTASAYIDYMPTVPGLLVTAPTNGSRVRGDIPITIKWGYSDSDTVQQKVVLQITSGGTTNSYTVTGTATEYAVPGGVVKVGDNVTFYITATYEGNVSKKYGPYNFKCYVPALKMAYPVEVNARNDRTTVFSWDFAESGSGQTSAVITFTAGKTGSYTISGNNHFYEFPPSTFSVGTITYKIKISYGTSATIEYGPFSFKAVGVTVAPDVTSVTNESIPMITWTSVNQDAFEIEIVNSDNNVVYESFLQIGDLVRSFRIKKILEDGAYFVRIRVLNSYGYYTDWSTYGFYISPTKPTGATGVSAGVRPDYGVSVNGNVPTQGSKYIVKRVKGSNDAVVIGMYSDGFVDYNAPLNEPYEYTVRTVRTGYKDGEWIPVTVKADGAIIRAIDDPEKMLHLNYSSDQFRIVSSDSRERSMFRCIGRRFPVVEPTEWVNTTRQFTAYVPNEDIEKLYDIVLENPIVIFQGNKESFKATLDIAETEDYQGRGKVYTFSVTRIHDEEESPL